MNRGWIACVLLLWCVGCVALSASRSSVESPSALPRDVALPRRLWKEAPQLPNVGPHQITCAGRLPFTWDGDLNRVAVGTNPEFDGDMEHNAALQLSVGTETVSVPYWACVCPDGKPLRHVAPGVNPCG